VAVRFDSGNELALEESYPAVAAVVPHARRRVADFASEAGASGEQLEGIRLSVSEAVTNVVQHAYGGRPGAVHLSAAAISGELWILVADDGRGLEPNRNSAGLGLGLAWMAQFSDGLTLVQRVSGGLEVRLRFDLLDGAAEPQAPAEKVSSL
jgi:anti-sigma regulatory factor (Ser/Thr protein kinase)